MYFAKYIQKIIFIYGDVAPPVGGYYFFESPPLDHGTPRPQVVFALNGVVLVEFFLDTPPRTCVRPEGPRPDAENMNFGYISYKLGLQLA